MTADLLAVLREAREALRSCAWSTELRTDDALMAMATADAKIGEATMMLTVSALRAHEAQGWMPIAEAPKDGTRIIVTNGTRVETARWLDNRHGKYAWAGWHFGSLVPAMTPNAWQPLPPPPEPPQ